ncbi:MAG: hypothetical protein KF905_02925 [Flavobacteriales bacterium]|nr:hypothetical protein [Flavobacteriales bacterium]
MRILWRPLLFFLFLMVLLWLCRAAAFRALVHYKVIGQRLPVPALTLHTTAPLELESAMEVALDSTAARLHFSTGKVSSDPALLLQGGPANCIGYAALCAALLKGQLDAAGLGDRYVVDPVIGKLYVGDQDLHAFITSPFWKDHDVVRITDLASNEVVVLDPTLYDHVGIGRVSYRSKN